MESTTDGRDLKATFVVEVRFQRNNTWQGSINWLDESRRQGFRSALEMVKLIDEAVTGGARETGVFNSWDEDIRQDPGEA